MKCMGLTVSKMTPSIPSLPLHTWRLLSQVMGSNSFPPLNLDQLQGLAWLPEASKSEILELLKLSHKKSRSFCLDLLEHLSLRCFFSEPSCHASRSPSQVERPHIITLVDNTSWAHSQQPASTTSRVSEPPGTFIPVEPSDGNRPSWRLTATAWEMLCKSCSDEPSRCMEPWETVTNYWFKWLSCGVVCYTCHCKVLFQSYITHIHLREAPRPFSPSTVIMVNNLWLMTPSSLLFW